MNTSHFLYLLPLGGIGLSILYIRLIIRSAAKLKELKTNEYETIKKEYLESEVHSKLKTKAKKQWQSIREHEEKQNISNHALISLNKTTVETEVYSINYSEARSEANSQIEIERNMRPYFNALTEYIRNTREFICVVDYPEHGKEMEQDGVFFQALQDNYNQYFLTIEDVVKRNPKVNYTRILQLPLGTPLEFMSDEAKVKCAISKLYTSTQYHINRMLDLKNFNLYIVAKSFINYSEVIIDNRVLFTELDRYDEKAGAKPNRLLINKSEPGENFSGTIRDEYSFIKYILTHQKPVTRQQIDIAIEEIQNEMNKKANTVKAFEKE
jgi:hypothetical protein